MNTMPLEADTRNLINTALTNLGWKLNGKDKNVFLNSQKQKQNVNLSEENVLIMCCTQTRVIDH